jgi:hypothetical protein
MNWILKKDHENPYILKGQMGVRSGQTAVRPYKLMVLMVFIGDVHWVDKPID